MFLDVRADAYFCVPAGAAMAEFEAGRRRLRSDAASLTASLAAAGLIEPAKDAPAACASPCPAPRRTARLPQPPKFSWTDMVEAARCSLDVLLTYRRRSLAELIQQARPPAEVEPPGLTPGLLAVVARFRRWAPFAPVSSKCLLRAYMLLRLLRRKGHDAHWVFGVATWPFAAHCWLQVGDVALDDDVDRLAIYRMILVV